MSILNNHIKQKIRREFQDIIVYNPTIEQEELIIEMLNQNATIDSNLNISANLNSRLTRTLIRELTNIGTEIDEFTDEELEDKLINGDLYLQKMLNELKVIVEEVCYKVQREAYDTINSFNKMLDIIDVIIESSESKNRVETVLDKIGVDLTLEELSDMQKNNPDKLAEILKSSKTKPKRKGKK